MKNFRELYSSLCLLGKKERDKNRVNYEMREIEIEIEKERVR